MKIERKIILLFTIKYPFGKIESFLEDELNILSKHFDKIVIVPSKRDLGPIRKLPTNCFLEEKLTEVKLQFSILNALRIVFPFLKVWFYSFIKEGFSLKYLRYFSGSLHLFYNDFAKYKEIKSIINNYAEANSNLIGYDYWLLNNSLSLIKSKSAGLFQKVICRAHGFDLYEERHVNNFLPFLKYKGDKLDKIYTISKHGESYLKSKNISNAKTNYLGIQIAKNGTCPDLKISDKPILVSCSAIIPVKRVSLIANAIKEIQQPITWVHFGNGQLEYEVKNIVDTIDKSKTIYFPGFIRNIDIQAFYNKYKVDYFISASESEGLPVSMMEAQAFGIPIIAPSINGIPEIVNSKTGLLFNPNINAKELAIQIENAIMNLSFDRQQIKTHYEDHFSAEVNYDKFAKDIIDLSSKS